MARLVRHFSTRCTPQSEPIPGSPQVPNSASGYAFAADDWTRLDRFLVLGTENGSYYATERALTVENAEAVRRCAAADGLRTVARVAAVSEAGRAPKNDPAVFALALAAGLGDGQTRAAALAAVPRVCRTGSHLFAFVDAVEGFRGWGRGLKRAVGSWYAGREPRDLAYHLAKYQARGGWSHRDLLRLCHVRLTGAASDAARWAIGKDGLPPISTVASADPLAPLAALEAAKRATSAEEVCRLIRAYQLVRECVPTRWLKDATVWDALLEQMPLGAMVRNLAVMTRVGLLAPDGAAAGHVVRVLGDRERLRRSRLHPVALLSALRTYAAGRGVRGGGTWQPVPEILEALDSAFYAAFAHVEPTGRRWLLALDVSGSRAASTVAGVPDFSAREAAAAMALVTAATEPAHHVVAFTGRGFRAPNGQPSTFGAWAQHPNCGGGVEPLDFGPRRRLDEVTRAVAGLPFGPTDCALPMLYALEAGVSADVFVVYTDSETWHGDVHPVQALRRYRERTGIPARLAVVGMTSGGFSIADPDDAGTLDVVGFDAAVPQLLGQFAAGEGSSRRST